MNEIDNPDSLPLLPAPLQPGDTIGLFCPAGPVLNLGKVKAGIAILQDMGFRIQGAGELQASVDNNTYLAASDIDRERQLNALWKDEEVNALMAVRGGYGCLRMVDRIDFTRFRANPKLLIGFSDLTVLLAACFNESRLIGLHGPVVSSLATSDNPSKERFFSLLKGDYRPYSFGRNLNVLRPGTGRGKIIVGNLTTICHLIGTPWEPLFAGSILIIEDTGESMYRLDRMLTHLALAGKFENLAGLILATFDVEGEGLLQEPLFERVHELTAGTKYPVWGNFPIGHLSQNQALPYGMEATMESRSSVLYLHPDSVQKGNFSVTGNKSNIGRLG